MRLASNPLPLSLRDLHPFDPTVNRPVLRELLVYRPLVRNLVLKDLKLKYRDSALGVLWSLLNPLLTLTVYTLVFKHILRMDVDHYAYFLLTGLLPWNFFSASLLASTRAVLDNAHLVKKVYFPREVLPIATVLFNFCQLLLALAIFLPALVFVSGVRLHWTGIMLPAVLALHLLFTTGAAFLLAATTVFFRDVAHLTEVGLLPLFWLTPILYPATMAPAALQVVFRASPMAAFAIAYQDLLFWGRVPPAGVLVALLGWTIAVLLVGHRVFRRCSPAFAEEA